MPWLFPGSRQSSPDIIVPDHIPFSFHILYRKRARIAFNDAKYEAEERARKLASDSQKPVTEEVAVINPLDSWDEVFEDCETELASDPIKSTTDTTSLNDALAALKESMRSVSANTQQNFLKAREEAPAHRVSVAAKVLYDFETYNTFVGNFAKQAGQRYATSSMPSKFNGIHNSARGAPSNNAVAPGVLRATGRYISDLSVSGLKPSSAVSEKVIRQPETDNQNEPDQHAGPSENPMLSTDNGLHHPGAYNSSFGVELSHPQPIRCISTSIQTFEVSAQPNNTSLEEFSDTPVEKSVQSLVIITQEAVKDFPHTNIVWGMEEVLKTLEEPVGLAVTSVGIAKPDALEKVQYDTSSQEIILGTNINKSEGHLTYSIEQRIRSPGSVVPMTGEVQISQPCSEIGITPIEHNLQKVVSGASRIVPEFDSQDYCGSGHLSIGANSDEASSVGRVTQVDSVKLGRASSTVIGNAGDSVGRPESEFPARNPKKPASEGSSNDGINWPNPHPNVRSPEIFQSWEDYDARKGDISIFPHYIEENRVRNSNESGNGRYFNDTIYRFGKVVQSVVARPGENRPPLRVYPYSNPAPVVKDSAPAVDRHPEHKSSIPTNTKRVKPPKLNSRAYQETLQIDSRGVVHPGRWNPYLRRFEILSKYNMKKPNDGLDFNGHKRRRGRSFNGSPLPGVPTRNCDHLAFKDVDAIGGPGKWSSSGSEQSNLEPRGGAETSAPGNDNLVGKSSAESANGNCKTEEAHEPLRVTRENLSIEYPSLDKTISRFLKTLNKDSPDIPERDKLTEGYPITHPVDPETIPAHQRFHFDKSGHIIWDSFKNPSPTEQLVSIEAEEPAENSGVSLPEVLVPKTEKLVEKMDQLPEVPAPSKTEEPAEYSEESLPEVSAFPKAENLAEEDQLTPKILVPLKTEKLVEEALAPLKTEKSVEKADQSPPKAPEPSMAVEPLEEADQSTPEVLEPSKTEKSVEEEDQSPPQAWARVNGVWVLTTKKVTYATAPRSSKYTGQEHTEQRDQKI